MLGEHTDALLQSLLNKSDDDIAALLESERWPKEGSMVGLYWEEWEIDEIYHRWKNSDRGDRIISLELRRLQSLHINDIVKKHSLASGSPMARWYTHSQGHVSTPSL